MTQSDQHGFGVLQKIDRGIAGLGMLLAAAMPIPAILIITELVARVALDRSYFPFSTPVVVAVVAYFALVLFGTWRFDKQRVISNG